MFVPAFLSHVLKLFKIPRQQSNPVFHLRQQEHDCGKCLKLFKSLPAPLISSCLRQVMAKIQVEQYKTAHLDLSTTKL